MKKLITFTLFALALPVLAQSRRAGSQNFASDFQTLPVVANVPGVGSTFQSYVSVFNPTSSAFSVTATLYDANGATKTATINLAAGEVKAFENFLQEVFNTTGGGAVTFSAPSTAGGTHNNRFVIDSEVWTSGTRFGTSIPALEFAGSSSRSFAAGISVDSNHRTNAGCFNQGSTTNAITLTILDASGKNTVGTTSLNLAPHAWGQTPILSVVTNGTIQFDPSDSAVCYAVTVYNATNDGRFINASEFQP
ncbi:MAG TPA: hypothetical protein VJ901_13495 [Thermoanaerobaculia bacterium]|nr:hypothetical protein [Thermoanaerobaculia bacterium]